MSSLSIDHTSRLPGTVKFYSRHLIICSGHNNWPARIEEAGGFITALNEAAKARPTGKETRITACDRPSAGPGTDVLVYPDAVRLPEMTKQDIPKLLNYLEGGGVREFATWPLEKPLFLVCSHYNRDPRCGQCGPGLYAAFKEIQSQRGLAGSFNVWRSSHLGGHRFAGIVVSYPSGNWYGRVTVSDVPQLVQAELAGSSPFGKLWRGRMGWNALEQLAFAERLAGGSGP